MKRLLPQSFLREYCEFPREQDNPRVQKAPPQHEIAEILARFEQHCGPLMAVAENRVIVNARVRSAAHRLRCPGEHVIT